MAAKRKLSTDERKAKLAKVYEVLKKVRASKTVTLKASPLMREDIADLDGSKVSFNLRYYQVQGAYHMIVLKRMVLGDDAGLGKTIQCLVALCHFFSKQPSTKVIVVTPKSTVHQWGAETLRFTKGVTPYIVETKAKTKKGLSPLEQRKAIYQAWLKDPNPSILVINYALLVRDWNAEGFQPVNEKGKPDPKKPVIPGVLDQVMRDAAAPGKLAVVYDECFDYHTPVQLANGSTEVIGKIVSNRQQIEVQSWSWEQNRVEAKPVVNWFRRKKPSNGSMVKVTTRAGRTCRVTSNHDFYTVKGSKKRASSLKEGSEVAFLDTLSPTEEQIQVVLGGLLGDASVKNPPTPNGLQGVSFIQGSQQRSYLDFKRTVLEPLGVSPVRTQKSGYTGEDSLYSFSLRSNPYFTLEHMFLVNGKRKPNLKWLDAIDTLGLAVWYGDDGSLQTTFTSKGEPRYHITFSTHGFSKEDCTLLQSWLYFKWGVSCRVGTTNEGHTLNLGVEASAKFLNLLPGALPGVEYKFPGSPTYEVQDTTPKTRLIRDEVLDVSSCEPKRPDNCALYVYDMEVADNHNYFVGRGTLVSNCQAFKNHRTKTWEVVRQLSEKSDRVYGLTATLLKSNLMEGYSIYKAIKPELFGSITGFIKAYCLTVLQAIPGQKRKIPVVQGYKNIRHFRDRIDPFFYGRFKKDVSDELPALVAKDVICELSAAENKKYSEALQGVLELGDGDIRDYEEHRALVALIYCQQVVDSLTLLKFKEGQVVDEGFDLDTFNVKDVKVGKLGAKEQALVDLLQGELEGEKVIVYTRFASVVPRLQAILSKEKIKSVCITGQDQINTSGLKMAGIKAKAADARKAAQKAFQDNDSDVKVIIITDAGGTGINLQMSRALVYYDLPWTWGDYVQILGRMIRIGSPHKGVMAYHMLAERPHDKGSRKTIDHHVLMQLRKKKKLIDQVLGEGIEGALEFEKGTSLKDLVQALQEDA